MGTDNKKTKVVYIIAALVSGGAERQLVYLLEKLDRRLYDPYLVAFAGGLWESRFRNLGVPIEIFSLVSGKASALRDLYSFLRRVRPEIVHGFGHSANYYGRAAAIGAGVGAVIASERSTPLIKSSIHLLLDRLLGPWTGRLITNSRHAADFYVEQRILPRHKVVTVVNGIETAAFPRTENYGKASLGYVGDFRREKNHALLLEAMADVVGNMPESRLHLAGDGPLRGDIEAQIRDLGIKDNVLLHGFVDDVPSFLGQLGLYVHTALYEGLPNAVMEAMACGLPCVVTDSPGCVELVNHGTTGLVVSQGDAAGLAGAVTRLVQDGETARLYGEAGASFIESDFSIEKMVAHTGETYQALLKI